MKIKQYDKASLLYRMILLYDSLCNPVISAKAAKCLAELLDEFCIYNIDFR